MALNILIVDDSAIMRKMISRSLRQAGIEIAQTREAENGAEALDALKEGEVNLILCDWNMPVMDGPTFIKEARRTYQTPIIMLTTEATDDKVATALELGANGHVSKPFTPEKLGERIMRVLSA